ncbi:MAG: DMT family protein [Phycisphaerales bacterium]|nr:DMT family protein [Phycisphaerales bacterium]
MSKALLTVLLLIGSNCFMTWAWYGHLKKTGWTIPVAIGISWLIAFPEYLLQVPANRIGHYSQGGPFTAAQLKVLQEAITMTVFIVFAIVVLKERPRWNEGVAFVLIFAGVLVAMMGRAPMIGTPPVDIQTPETDQSRS